MRSRLAVLPLCCALMTGPRGAAAGEATAPSQEQRQTAPRTDSSEQVPGGPNSSPSQQGSPVTGRGVDALSERRGQGMRMDSPSVGRPLELQAALERVRRLDPTVRGKMIERMRAAVALSRAKWKRWQVHLGTRVGYMLGSAGWADTDGWPSKEYQRVGLGAVASIRVPIYDAGAIGAQIDASREQERVKESERRISELDAQRQLVVTYAALVAAQQKVEAMQRALDRAEGLMRLARARKETGVGSQADVARARLNLVGRKEQLLAVQQVRATAEATLQALLFLPPTHRLRATTSLQALAKWRIGGDGPPPELGWVDAKVRAARYRRDQVQADRLPKVDLLGSLSYGNLSGLPWSGEGGLAAGAVPPDDRLVGNLAGNAAAGVVVSWSAFDSFATRDAIRDAELSVAATEQQRRAVRRDLTRRYREALARERFSSKRRDLLIHGMKRAAEAVALARDRYETGNGLLTEVLDAELEAISVEMRLIEARYDVVVAHVQRVRYQGGTR